MSVATATPGSGQPAPPAAPDSCPLCGGPLQPGQDWCLRCGGAARTRLAASPNWKVPVVAVALVVALALGGLAAALVKLAGETGPVPTRTATVTTTVAAATPPVTTAPAPTTTAPAGRGKSPSLGSPAGGILRKRLEELRRAHGLK